jgi:hypothetical protein
MSSTEFARGGLASEFDTTVTDRAADVTTAASDPAPPRWSLPTRIGFRFFATYFLLYVMFTQMYSSLLGRLLGYLPFTVVPPGSTQAVRSMREYIALSWLKFPLPLSQNQGAGDKPVDYALVVGLLVIASAITALWSAVDWKRQSYPRLKAWTWVFVRFSLATSLATYGWIKAFPLQMSFPPLTRMLEPYGHFTLMAVLWSKIGSSTAYEIFTGCAELLAAVLLLIPGLSTLGALIAIPVTFQVWMLNMTYDVPVKLFSLHLLAMSTFLILPDLRRLLNFFVLKRATDPPQEGRLFRSLRAHRIAIAVQVVFAVFLLWGGYQQGKAGAAARLNQPRPPLYGIWNIDRMMINGVERAPLLTDYDRWRRMVVQVPTAISFQRMNDTWAGFSATTDLAAKTIVFTTFANPQAAAQNPANAARKEIGRFTIEQPAPDRMILAGTLSGKTYRMETSYFDPEKLRLKAATFKWIQDRPWNISSADYVSQSLR